MNERIQELAEQAGLKVESWMTNPPKPFQILGSTEQFEKFAELIVKECMQMCRAEYNEFAESASKNNGRESDFAFGSINSAERIENNIKQYFGVK